MRRNIILALLLILIAAAGAGAYFMALPRDEKPRPVAVETDDSVAEGSAPADLTYRVVPLKTAAKTYQLQLADTQEKQSLGLSKRKSIGGDGMLFPYSKPQKLCFWMKDMNFAIDMLWLDANKQVIKLQPKVSPDTYPQTTYCQTDAQYVVELDSGEAAKSGIAIGTTLDIAL